MRIRDLSIRFNLALLILSASVLAVLLASFGFAIYERQSYRASAVRELTALADTLGANTAASLAFNDQRTANEMLGALATEPHVLVACLYDNDGTSLRNTADRRHARVSSFPRCATTEPTSMASLSLFSAGSCSTANAPGSIALVFDLSEFRSRLLEYAKIAVLVLLLSVLVTFLASLATCAVSLEIPWCNWPLSPAASRPTRTTPSVPKSGPAAKPAFSFDRSTKCSPRFNRANGRSKAYRKAKSAMPSPLAAPTTAFGTGTSPPVRSTSLLAGAICSVTQRASPGLAPNNGSAKFIPQTASASALRSPRIATARLRSSSVNTVCVTRAVAISGR